MLIKKKVIFCFLRKSPFCYVGLYYIYFDLQSKHIDILVILKLFSLLSDAACTSLPQYLACRACRKSEMGYIWLSLTLTLIGVVGMPWNDGYIYNISPLFICYLKLVFTFGFVADFISSCLKLISLCFWKSVFLLLVFFGGEG